MVIIGSGNGFVLNKWQSITVINDNMVHRCINVLPDRNQSIEPDTLPPLDNFYNNEWSFCFICTIWRMFVWIPKYQWRYP